MRKLDYKIVTSDGGSMSVSFDYAMERALEDGWTPIGGCSYRISSYGHPEPAQAMVRPHVPAEYELRLQRKNRPWWRFWK